tara:strand:+ start:5991 stop:6356 length:366 start_codon:yes stop_codon:yes gene_type:complete
MSEENKEITPGGPKESSPEELLEAKKKDMQENPDNYMDVKDIIICVRRGPKGIELFIGSSSATELKLGWATVNQAVMETLFMMRSHAIQQTEKDRKVVMPGQARFSHKGKNPGAFGNGKHN